MDAGRAAGAGRSSRGAPDSGTAEAREGPEPRIPLCLWESGRLEPDGPRRGGAADPQVPRLARSAAGARHPAPDPAWRTPGLA